MNIQKNQTCCFSGYRPHKLPEGGDEKSEEIKKLKWNLEKEILIAVKDGYRYFLSGMAQGFDMFAAESVLGLKKLRFCVRLVAVVPCETQADNWRNDWRERYFNILAGCDDVVYIAKRYDGKCMFMRDRFMIDRSGRMITCYDGNGGGTAYMHRYAKRQGLSIRYV